MGIPNDSVTQNEIAEEKRQEEEAVKRQRLEQSLEKGLEALERDLEILPAPDAANVRQPSPSSLDQTKK
jgi:hypothetical protein